jgi:hypothetical protein
LRVGFPEEHRPTCLFERQLTLLEFLNSLEQTSVTIKPYVGSTADNCAILPVLKRLPNLEVARNVTLTDFLKNRNPRAIILDLPSTPLYEVVHLDVEIFVLNDPFCPLSHEALSKLQKRVHYFESVDEAIRAIGLWSRGGLPKKRGTAFLNRYVLKPDTQRAIFDVVTALTQ